VIAQSRDEIVDILHEHSHMNFNNNTTFQRTAVFSSAFVFVSAAAPATRFGTLRRSHSANSSAFFMRRSAARRLAKRLTYNARERARNAAAINHLVLVVAVSRRALRILALARLVIVATIIIIVTRRITESSIVMRITDCDLA
jgi:hypothetical protein